MDNGGVKNDGHKPDLSLLPRTALEQIALAFMDGEKKYGRYNYRRGMKWSRLIGATLRHVFAFASGEDYAPDSGIHHLAHAGANIIMLLEFYFHKLGTDNRLNDGDNNEKAVA